VHINSGFGDYNGWYFDKNGALVVGSSEFNGWLGEFIPYPSSLLINRTYAMLCYAMLCYAMLCYAMLCYATKEC